MKLRSGSKRRSDRAQGQPKPGTAAPGKAIDPMGMADESGPAEVRRGDTWAAPAPGVPVSDEEYDSLKRKAKTVRTPLSRSRQEDPSGRKKR
jgi:hypothetical protein